MNWVTQAIEEFGRSIGITGLGGGDPGNAVQLGFESGEALCLEPVDDELLVYLAAEIPPHDAALKARALGLCHPGHQWPLAVQAGLRDRNRLVFLVRLPERSVSLPAIEQAVDLLRRLHALARG